jgi:1-acyl-sn-glycerol-3-phosphate acyltransferase
MWEGEYGFIKLALLTGAPIIPIASIGLDENFHLISQGTFINRILFGPDAFLLPIVRPNRIIPKKVTLYVGNPITLPYPPEATKDQKLLHRLQQKVKRVLEEMIAQHLGE